jgi:sec-independent protein translocase protein TatB
VFDIGGGELVALGVLSLIVLGPEKLPRYAAEAARTLQKLREMAGSAREDVRRELGPEFDNLTMADLNPKTLVKKHLLDPIDIDSLDLDGSAEDDKPAARRGPGEPPKTSPDPAPFDPDTT